MLYYDFAETSTGVSLTTGVYQGYVTNVSPSSTVGSFNGVIDRATGASEAVAKSSIDTFWLNDQSGVNLSYSNVRFGPFSGAGFLPPNEYDSDSTFLFSFSHVNQEDGVIFGSLVRDQFDNNGQTGVYGRGFNFGVNDRNKLFFQGIDPFLGEYVLVANELELATKNVCSVQVSPYAVTFGYYNLADDLFQQQTLRSNSRIENNSWTESFFLGKSNTYYKNSNLSGYLDEFMVFSGAINGDDLKSISSGFYSTGVPNSGASSQSVNITGYSYQYLYPTGITGYASVLTGYQSLLTTGEYVEFILQSGSSGLKEGERFFTGYALNNGFNDHYLEEVGFLIKDNTYATTGDGAHATLGLKDVSQYVTGYTLTYVRSNVQTGYLPLYSIQSLTGFLSDATGYVQTPLYSTGTETGILNQTLSLKTDYTLDYRHDYLYYLGERI